MLDKENTGDGLVTALSLLEVKRTVGSLPKFTPYPMLELNVYADNPSKNLASGDFQEKINKVNALYAKSGRLIVRPSGTEPYIRITYECFSSSPDAIFDEIKRYSKASKRTIEKRTTDKEQRQKQPIKELPIKEQTLKERIQNSRKKYGERKR